MDKQAILCSIENKFCKLGLHELLKRSVTFTGVDDLKVFVERKTFFWKPIF